MQRCQPVTTFICKIIKNKSLRPANKYNSLWHWLLIVSHIIFAVSGDSKICLKGHSWRHLILAIVPVKVDLSLQECSDGVDRQRLTKLCMDLSHSQRCCEASWGTTMAPPVEGNRMTPSGVFSKITSLSRQCQDGEADFPPRN